MSYLQNTRDNNEPDVLNEFKTYPGALWLPMCKDEGFDGLGVYQGKVLIIEIKNPIEAKKKYKNNVTKMLTAPERKKYQLLGPDVYHIILWPNDLLFLFGMTLIPGGEISNFYTDKIPSQIARGLTVVDYILDY